MAEMTERTRQAIDEGDLRDDLDPQAVGETIVSSMLGAELLANATHRRSRRPGSAWRGRGRCCYRRL